ncbi:MAG: hypothetical protein AAGF11_30215 [Myxococcota bacterium]
MRCRRRFPWGWAAALLTVGCTRVSDRSRFEEPAATVEILQTEPRPDAVDVSPMVRIDLCMSGRLDPRSLDEVDANISSGGALTDTELSVQLVPWLAPGAETPPEDRQMPWCEGSVLSVQPRAPLRAGALHRLRLVPSAVGWAGEPMSTEGPRWRVDDEGNARYTLEFTIDADPPGERPDPDEPPEPLTLHDLFETGGPFDPMRAQCSCHRDPEDLALARLDLRDPVSAFEDLLSSSQPRETGFGMVAPRDPSQSFLVQKLLREPDGSALHGILGDPMPPDDLLPYDDLLTIIEWVEDGAAL